MARKPINPHGPSKADVTNLKPTDTALEKVLRKLRKRAKADRQATLLDRPHFLVTEAIKRLEKAKKLNAMCRSGIFRM
jgi:hypothetical protein